MSHDGISFEFPEIKRDDDFPIGNVDAVIERYFHIYKRRHEDEMDWRLRRVIESAWKDGNRAAKERIEELEEALKLIRLTCGPGQTHNSARDAVNRARGIANKVLNDG